MPTTYLNVSYASVALCQVRTHSHRCGGCGCV